jgi:hypothetical protein
MIKFIGKTCKGKVENTVTEISCVKSWYVHGVLFLSETLHRI